MRALRRVGQFWAALRAGVRPDELSALEEYLQPDERALFLRMSTWDQRHCLDVCARLRAAGRQDEALLRAALLHDVGKSAACISVWHRSAAVLLGAVWPGGMVRLASYRKTAGRWGYTFHVLGEHAALGADLAAQAGSPAEVQDYIRRHHQPVVEGPVAWLRWADGQLVSKSEVLPCLESPLSERV
ncbi:MAG: HDOD domain-containing protein [Chloroflexi bacterium]|nr:HDOD domain-containing protein [Chloroflexota bacterium]